MSIAWQQHTVVVAFSAGISSRALEEAAGAGECNRRIHHPFTNTEVLVDPFGNLLVLASNFFGLEAIDASSLVEKGRIGEALFIATHVKPVERFMPARKADTRDY